MTPDGFLFVAQRALLSCSLALLLTARTASGAPPAQADDDAPEEAPRSAVMINPLGPAGAVVGSLVGRSLVGGDGIGLSVGLLDLNLRGHHSVTERLGLSAQLDYSRLDFILQTRHLAARVGPRFSLGEGGLEAWALSPFALVGHTWVHAGDLPLARWEVLGVGAEAGRVWVRGRFAFELGLGAYTSANLGFRSDVEEAVGSAAPRGSWIKPVINVGLGHAF